MKLCLFGNIKEIKFNHKKNLFKKMKVMVFMKIFMILHNMNLH